MEITASQIDQLLTFLQEQEHTRTDTLRPAVNLGGNNIEAVLLDRDGRETAVKRILYP